MIRKFNLRIAAIPIDCIKPMFFFLDNLYLASNIPHNALLLPAGIYSGMRLTNVSVLILDGSPGISRQYDIIRMENTCLKKKWQK